MGSLGTRIRGEEQVGNRRSPQMKTSEPDHSPGSFSTEAGSEAQGAARAWACLPSALFLTATPPSALLSLWWGSRFTPGGCMLLTLREAQLLAGFGSCGRWGVEEGGGKPGYLFPFALQGGFLMSVVFLLQLQLPPAWLTMAPPSASRPLSLGKAMSSFCPCSHHGNSLPLCKSLCYRISLRSQLLHHRINLPCFKNSDWALCSWLVSGNSTTPAHVR